jgi:trehalose-6-phosphate synthase
MIAYSDDLSYNDYWNAYQEINIQFAKEISRIRETEKDLIWVNDLHLILVPSYLRS